MDEIIKILKQAIELLKLKYNSKDYLIMDAIRELCPKDDLNYTLKTVIRVLPNHIVSLSYKTDLAGNISILKSTLNMIDW